MGAGPEMKLNDLLRKRSQPVTLSQGALLRDGPTGAVYGPAVLFVLTITHFILPNQGF